MNKDKVMAMIRKRSSESGVSVNTLLLTYFFERFLVRLSGSEYKTDLILKGGFLLSSIMGIETRTTMDMDMSLRNRRMDAESIRGAVENIISVSSDDEVIYEIRSIEEIKIEDKYSGYRVSVMGRLSNIRQPFSIDIATGDPITPEAIEYRYRSAFPDEQDITLISYNLETIVAEKLETMVSRKTDNSRSKDLYDLHLIWTLKKDRLDHDKLIGAISTTFDYRGTEYDAESILEGIEDIRADDGFRRRWETYCRKNAYVDGIAFDDMLNEIRDNVKDLM